jgi:hypothetical protein
MPKAITLLVPALEQGLDPARGNAYADGRWNLALSGTHPGYAWDVCCGRANKGMLLQVLLHLSLFEDVPTRVHWPSLACPEVELSNARERQDSTARAMPRIGVIAAP